MQKKGGNVAAYFLTPDGRVLGATLGAVDATAFLDEAVWALEAAKSPTYAALAKAHAARHEHYSKNPKVIERAFR